MYRYICILLYYNMVSSTQTHVYNFKLLLLRSAYTHGYDTHVHITKEDCTILISTMIYKVCRFAAAAVLVFATCWRRRLRVPDAYVHNIQRIMCIICIGPIGDDGDGDCGGGGCWTAQQTTMIAFPCPLRTPPPPPPSPTY